MAKENMMCPGQKANSKDWNSNYDEIFKNMQSVEYKKEMRTCSMCETKCGELYEDEWIYIWHQICNSCVNEMGKGEDI